MILSECQEEEEMGGVERAWTDSRIAGCQRQYGDVCGALYGAILTWEHLC